MKRCFVLLLLLLAQSAMAQTYPAGTRLRLTATPNAGATFSGWSGGASGSVNPIEIVLAANVTVVATFAVSLPPPTPPQDPALTVQVVGPGTVAVVVVSPIPICGNGAIETGEQCDDGNMVAGDGCSVTCQAEVPPIGADDWAQIPGTKLRPVLQPGLVAPGIGITWPQAIFLAESGAAMGVDGALYSLVGGGHADGGPNNVYRLPLVPTVGTWERLTDTSPTSEILAKTMVSSYSDGQPVARHTYNGVMGIPDGRVLLYSGSRWWSGASDNALFAFDPIARTWTRLADSPSLCCSVISTSSGWDAVRGEWILRRATRVFAYKPSTNVWRTIATNEGDEESAERPGVVVGDAFWMFGQGNQPPGEIWRYQLPGPSVRAIVPYTGETALLSGRTREIGVVWEPALNKVVAWRGGSDLYLIDVSVDPVTITRHPMAGGIPPAAYTQGTFGRFARIAPGKYVYAHDIDQDVWLATLDVAPPPLPPPPEPLPPDDTSARLICPTGETTAIPNDPYRDGCWSKPFDEAPFFTAAPYSCSTLKPGVVYLGSYSWADGGGISTRKCVDVYTSADFRTIQNFGPREQMIALIHNDLFVATADFLWLPNRGELFILGLPRADKPPALTSDIGTLVNWQETSGNFAIGNLMLTKGISAGSAFLPHKQTVTMIGVTFHGDSRVLFTSYEGGADPPTPINDEVYIKNSMAYGAINSHNLYLDRNRLQYAEGLVTYGNRGDSNHGIKMEAQQIFVYGSWFSNAGILGNMADDDSGNAGFDSVSCHEGVVRGNHFMNAAIEGGSNPTPYQTQLRFSLVSCDMPQGWVSNTYPARPYKGPVDYRGVHYETSPYWDPAWWTTSDSLATYIVGNTVTTRNNGVYRPASPFFPWRGFMSQGSFPATAASSSDLSQIPTPDMPPLQWREQTLNVLANNCLDGDILPDQHLFLNYRVPGLSCANASWRASWPECQAGAVYLNETNRFVTVGANQCGQVEPLPQNVLEGIARLEQIPDPPWRHWI